MREARPDIARKLQIDSAPQGCILRRLQPKARWQSGYAAACKAVDAGSIPTLASIFSPQARVAELVDAADLKSAVRKDVPVRVRPWAPKRTLGAVLVLTASQFSIKTNELLDFLRAFWDNGSGPTEMHNEDRDRLIER